MRHIYKIILVQHGESDVEQQISIHLHAFGIIFGKEKFLKTLSYCIHWYSQSQ